MVDHCSVSFGCLMLVVVCDVGCGLLFLVVCCAFFLFVGVHNSFYVFVVCCLLLVAVRGPSFDDWCVLFVV